VAVIFTTAVKSLSKAEEVWRESLAFTPRELGGIEAGLRPYLVVGYALREPPPGTLTASKESKEQRPVGVVCPDSVIAWAESNVIYVVSEIYARARDTTRLIIEPQQSLANECSMLILAFRKNKDKWFLTELQDVLTAVDPRRRTGLFDCLSREKKS
jgi:hypothetical protein